MTSKAIHYITIGVDYDGSRYPMEGFRTDKEAREMVFEGECVDVLEVAMCFETGRIESARSVWQDMLPDEICYGLNPNERGFVPPVYEKGLA